MKNMSAVLRKSKINRETWAIFQAVSYNQKHSKMGSVGGR